MKWMSLRRDGEQLRIDFIRTELETCRTFTSLAATEYEIGDREAAEHCIGESEKAYRTVFRFLSGVTCVEEMWRIQTKLRELRETLDNLRQRIGKI